MTEENHELHQREEEDGIRQCDMEENHNEVDSMDLSPQWGGNNQSATKTCVGIVCNRCNWLAISHQPVGDQSATCRRPPKTFLQSQILYANDANITTSHYTISKSLYKIISHFLHVM